MAEPTPIDTARLRRGRAALEVAAAALDGAAPENALQRARRLAREAAVAAQDQAREARALLDAMVESAEAVAALDAVPGGVRQIWATQARQLRTAGLNIDALMRRRS